MKSFKLSNVYLKYGSSIGNVKEKDGPVGKYFDYCFDDLSCGEKTWEKAEIKMYKKAIDVSLMKSKLDLQDIGLIISADLNNQIVIGSYALAKAHQEDTFLRAQKIRRLIVDKVNEILSTYDAIVLPAAGDVAGKFDAQADKISSNYLIAENHLAIANFAGLPSITIPMGLKEGLPLGINITGRLFDEQNTLNLAYALECELGYKNMMAGGNK